ncbi:hypothetical protein PIB30_013284 [Stylosanthes scabra]|uniref:Uncharacterized protein n=1 Tax=Stylosanthes scabra TaxID=79078 RepID=A0ABU6S6A4_9FABA|nr:hypothetical protein [Stylosanthes scabra]
MFILNNYTARFNPSMLNLASKAIHATLSQSRPYLPREDRFFLLDTRFFIVQKNQRLFMKNRCKVWFDDGVKSLLMHLFGGGRGLKDEQTRNLKIDLYS